MYKKIACACLLITGIQTLAFADSNMLDDSNTTTVNNDTNITIDGPAIYFGGQLGISNTNYGKKYTIPGNTVDNKTLAGRGYIGYAFSQFISLELGYDYYGSPKFKNSGATQKLIQQGADLVVKANLPLDYGFAFYIKGGLAWVYRSALHSQSGLFLEEKANGTFTPLGGIGASYALTNNLALDLVYTKTLTVTDLPTIDFLALGLIFKFNI